MTAALTTISLRDRRNAARCVLSGGTLLTIELGDLAGGLILDISLGGFAVQALAPLQKTGPRTISLNFNDGQPVFRVRADLVWSKKNVSGFRFDSLGVVERQRLHAWLRANRAPLQHEASRESPNTSPLFGTQQHSHVELESLLVRARRMSHADGVLIASKNGSSWTCQGRVGIGPEIGSTLRDDKGLLQEAANSRETIRYEHPGRIANWTSAGAAIVIPLDNPSRETLLVCLWTGTQTCDHATIAMLSIVGQLICFVLGCGTAPEAHKAAPHLRSLDNSAASVQELPAALETKVAPAASINQPPAQTSRSRFGRVLLTTAIALALLSSALCLGWFAGRQSQDITYKLFRTFGLSVVVPTPAPLPAPPVNLMKSSIPDRAIAGAAGAEPTPGAPTGVADPAVKPVITPTRSVTDIPRVGAVTSYPTPTLSHVDLSETSPAHDAYGSGGEPIKQQTFTAPLLLRRIKPAYPAAARASDIRGQVVLTFTVAPSGDVSDISVLSGHHLLAQASKTALRQWKYKPAEANGVAVASPATVVFDFTISSSLK